MTIPSDPFQSVDWLIALAYASQTLVFGCGTHALFTILENPLRMTKKATYVVPKPIVTD